MGDPTQVGRAQLGPYKGNRGSKKKAIREQKKKPSIREKRALRVTRMGRALNGCQPLLLHVSAYVEVRTT